MKATAPDTGTSTLSAPSWYSTRPVTTRGTASEIVRVSVTVPSAARTAPPIAGVRETEKSAACTWICPSGTFSKRKFPEASESFC